MYYGSHLGIRWRTRGEGVRKRKGSKPCPRLARWLYMLWRRLSKVPCVLWEKFWCRRCIPFGIRQLWRFALAVGQNSHGSSFARFGANKERGSNETGEHSFYLVGKYLATSLDILNKPCGLVTILKLKVGIFSYLSFLFSFSLLSPSFLLASWPKGNSILFQQLLNFYIMPLVCTSNCKGTVYWAWKRAWLLI